MSICLENIEMKISKVLSWWSFPDGSDGKESACNVGDLGTIPRSGRFPGDGNGYSRQYSCHRIPQTEKPGRLQSMGSQRVGHD